MSDQSNHLFRHCSSAVFAPDGADGIGSNPTTPLSSMGNGMTQYDPAFDKEMNKQFDRYNNMIEKNDRKNDMQSVMDLAVKTSKAVAT